MEVEVAMVGPTFNIGKLVVVPAAQDRRQLATAGAPPSPCIFINAEGDNDPDVEGSVSLISSMMASSEKSPDYSSDSSSSIGAPSDDEEDEEENAVSSKGALASLDSIEESLPIKRGLSNHFSGKSKSFGNLLDMSCCTVASKMKDVEKAENPFNKRRRILMANKLFNSTRKSSFYGWSNNPKSMPVLAALDELEEDEKERGTRYGYGDHGPSPSPSSSSSSSSSSLMSPSKQLSEQEDTSVESRKFKSGLCFKSQSCFALSDLQEEEDDDDPDHHD